MTAWSDRITEPFQPEFSQLWVALDPDELLLVPGTTAVLEERGFEILPLRHPLAFRLEYETRFRSHGGDAAPLIVHVTAKDDRRVPWDVLCASRTVRRSVAELFPMLDPNAVKAIGPEKFDALYEAVRRQNLVQSLGANASREFIISSVYGVVPSLIATPAEFWAARFDLFFRGDDLPIELAGYLSSHAPLPAGMKTSEAAEIMASRAAFLDRVQRDWGAFAKQVASGGEDVPNLIPFTYPRIRISIDSMILDGAVKPVPVDTPPVDVPAWMRIGIVDDGAAAKRLLEKQIEQLEFNVPDVDADHRSWLAFGIRQAEVLSSFFTASPPIADELRPKVEAILAGADTAFFSWLERDYGSLASNSAVKAPTVVHQVADHMGHHRSGGDIRQALIVVDGLALDQWFILEEQAKSRRSDLLIETQSCFAWLPTLTSISRQSIFAGNLPRTFAGTIETTSAEPAAWSRFWREEGIDSRDIGYMKGIGLPGTAATALQLVDAGKSVVGLVVDTVDQIMHGEVLGKAAMAARIRHWTENGEWDRLVDGLIAAGYTIFITADHGNVEAVGIGRPAEGVLAEAKGERSRMYGSETLRDNALRTINGSRTLKLGGLPAGQYPVFPPFGAAFLPKGSAAVVHGGPSIEEVIVPFVRITRKEK